MRLVDILGIELPVVQAPMAGAQGTAMAIAVASAGGLCSLPCAMLTAEGLRRDLASMRAKAEAEGSGDFSPLWSGQNASGCREVPAAQLTRELAAGL